PIASSPLTAPGGRRLLFRPGFRRGFRWGAAAATVRMSAAPPILTKRTFMTPAAEQVDAIIRSVAAEIILPRFRNLATHEVSAKTQGEIVTIADHESEARLIVELTALVPGSVVVGEEGAAADPAIFGALGGSDPV